MRILTVGNMYPPHHLGGYELVWRSAVEHLRARGHEVTVLTTDHRQPSVDASDPGHVHRELRWWWRDHGWPRHSPAERLRIERHNARVLGRLLEARGPEVVAWFAMGGMSLSLIERVRRQGIPAVGVVHDDWLVYGPRVDAWLRMWAGAARRPVASVAEHLTGIPAAVDFSAAGRWLFVSEATRRRALGPEGPPLDRTGVLHSGIDPSYLADPPPAGKWRWRLLYTGRIDPRKGIDTAVEALAALPEPARLRVVGEGDETALAQLRAQAQELGVSSRVAFAGGRTREELRDEYDDADVVLFPVRWDEPWGLVPIEAMARGRPVVATGRGGSGEYLRDGRNCVLFRAGDAEELAAAVRRLSEQPDLRDVLRAEGLRLACTHTEVVFNEGLEAALVAEAVRRADTGL